MPGVLEEDDYGYVFQLDPDDEGELLYVSVIFNFSVGSHTILPGHVRWLATAAGLLQLADSYLEIMGMASKTGSRAFNQKLSEGRAKSTRAWLLDASIKPSQIHVTKGVGWDELGASSTMGREEPADRRVQMFVWRKPVALLTENYRKMCVNRVRMTFTA